MPKPPFSFADAYEICLAPYLLETQRREDERRTQARGEAQRSGGVTWAGLGAEPSRPPRSRAEIRAEAEAALARATAFAESPRGRFLISVRELEQSGYAAQAENARAAFARGFADPGRPACPAEIGAALAVLAPVDQPAARTACLALAELLGGALGLAAA